jgi:3-hydroxybutyryl-CoA dehydrogenase
MKIDDVKRILVVGAGQMGAQIAMQSALHGYAITLNDLTMDVLQKGMAATASSSSAACRRAR